MKTITCPTCNLVCWATVESCKRCGAIFSAFQSADEPRLETPAVDRSYVPSDPQRSESHPETRVRTETYENRGQSDSRYQRAGSNQNKGLAIWSLVLGILAMPPISTIGLGILIGLLAALLGTPGLIIGGVVFLLILPSGLITGIMAISRASKRPREFGGKGFAIAGIVLSAFSLLFVPIVAAIAIPNLLAARRAANEGSAVSTLRKLRDMQTEYTAANDGKCGDIDMLTWDKSPQNASVNAKSGYQFVITHHPSAGCEINALPLVAEGVSATGVRSFFMSSEDGWTIRSADKGGRAATIDDKELGDYSDTRTARASRP
jgi:type IV pilus assembly protein PilA